MQIFYKKNHADWREFKKSQCDFFIDGRRKPRPGLPSGKECCKQSDPEQLVVRRSEGNWTRAWEYETPPASGTRERSSRYHGFEKQKVNSSRHL